MYLIYEQDYDNFDVIGYTDNLEYAKEYANYFGKSWMEVNKILEDKSLWPSKTKIYRIFAAIDSSSNVQLYTSHNGEEYFPEALKCYQEGIFEWTKYIFSVSYSSLEEATANLNEVLKLRRVRNFPTKYGGIDQEFVSVKENN